MSSSPSSRPLLWRSALPMPRLTSFSSGSVARRARMSSVVALIDSACSGCRRSWLAAAKKRVLASLAAVARSRSCRTASDSTALSSTTLISVRSMRPWSLTVASSMKKTSPMPAANR